MNDYFHNYTTNAETNLQSHGIRNPSPVTINKSGVYIERKMLSFHWMLLLRKIELSENRKYTNYSLQKYDIKLVLFKNIMPHNFSQDLAKSSCS